MKWPVASLSVGRQRPSVGRHVTSQPRAKSFIISLSGGVVHVSRRRKVYQRIDQTEAAREHEMLHGYEH